MASAGVQQPLPPVLNSGQNKIQLRFCSISGGVSSDPIKGTNPSAGSPTKSLILCVFVNTTYSEVSCPGVGVERAGVKPGAPAGSWS